MNAISSINNNYHVAMKSSQVQNPMVSEPYYNIMEEPVNEKPKMGIWPIALSILGVIGIGVGIYKSRQVSGLQDEITKLTKEAKNKDELLKTAGEKLKEAESKISEFEKTAKEVAEKAKETVKEGAEKVAETVKEGVNKVKENGFFKKIGNKIKEGWNKIFNKGGNAPKA